MGKAKSSFHRVLPSDFFFITIVNPCKTRTFNIAIYSKKGHPVSVIFSFLLASIFTHGSTYRSYRKQKEELPFSDKTFRNLLNDPRIHWQKLQILIAKAVLAFLRPLTSQDRKT
ncbi:hypothetical protein LQF63_12775, partial [Tetragenococcus koreensis]|nr:hypothetical protein [Tetragenococcus koreensis]